MIKILCLASVFFSQSFLLRAVGDSSPTATVPGSLPEEAAAIEFGGGQTVDVFKPGAGLFTDRPYVVEECPDWLRGKNFLRSSIGQPGNWTVTRSGVLTLLTPDPADSRATTQFQALEKLGFLRVESPGTFQLFGKNPWDRVRIYQKQVTKGERLNFGKWVVVLGFDKGIRHEEKPWSQNDGERLYNGIVLPGEWPPRNIDPADKGPMPVPYLDFPPEVIPIDVGRQLFVDDFLIGKTDLTRTFHQPEKFAGNPVLKPETPIERGEVEPEGHVKPYGHGNAGAGPKSGGCWWDPDEKVFKLWYETSWFGPIALAISRDGLHWERPDFDIRPGTNIVSPRDMTPDSWTVVRNWNASDPGEKWVLYVQPPGSTQPGTCLASPDGIHWSRRVKTGPTGDRSTLFYNPFRKKWVFSLRSSVRGRSRHYYEATDFMREAQWNELDTVVWAMADELDPPDPYIGDAAQLYNLDAVAYESLLLGVFEIHRGPDNNVCAKAGVPKITELNFAYSRDGFHWCRPDRRAHIPAERKDVWDRGYIQSLGNVCVIRGDRLLFYYIGFRGNTDKAGSGNSMYDRSATGVAFLRRDGFASMEAGEKPGALTTRPVVFSGKRLFVNIDAPQGELRVEILDKNDQVIAPFTKENCEPVTADKTLQAVRWKEAEDLSALAGKPVRFRFHLTNGKLYAFWVSPDETGRSGGYVAGGGPGYTGPTDTVGLRALEADAISPTSAPSVTGPKEALHGKKKVYVLLFGGQSNALGWGYRQYLEDTGDPLARPQDDVEMFYDFQGNGLLPENRLLPLQSGNSNTNVKPLPNCYPGLTQSPISRFGPELSFARTVRDHIPDPDARLVVIKFALGATTLWKHWLADGTASSGADGTIYRIFQDVAKRGLAAVREKYPDATVEVLGMGWVQGESDAIEGRGEEYQRHLSDFIADVRATFGSSFPFVLAKIAPQQIEGCPDSKMIEQWKIVRAAQDSVAASVPGVTATETDGEAYPVAKGLSEGQYHYTTPALLQIGKDLGNALVAACHLNPSN